MEIMSQCDICSGGCPVNSHRVSEWVLSIRIFLAVWTNLKQTAVCYLWKKGNYGMVQAWFSSIVWNCLKTNTFYWTLLNFQQTTMINIPFYLINARLTVLAEPIVQALYRSAWYSWQSYLVRIKKKKQLLSERSGLHKLLWGCVRRDIWCKNLPMWCYPLWWSLVNTAESSFSKC